ncbi:glyoxylate reductase/hydroxypyruvate reductase-like isoform X2 [Chrysoperla carnea]|uniref:glyoxylate reductase/hydroxypyruvate reductase-like isoform X2 n=1 Tax=Chrysoperla carnea TaxID=189513 RepID=UPI001D08C451|nr:glyoxylate reductase/hydroxypyruvate reductase-like isoform X2 [Chrysoperla carnea]
MGENKFKILIAHPYIPKFVTEMFHERGYIHVEQCIQKPGPTNQELRERLPGTYALIWWPDAANPNRCLTKELLDLAGPNLRAVCTVSSGYDMIDVQEIKARGILLGHMNQVQDAAVAEMAVLLTLAATRRLKECHQDNGTNTEWSADPEWMMGMDLPGSTVGIVGLGSIGKAILQRLKGFDVKKFLYTGRSPKPKSETYDAEFVTFDELLNNSDYVIVACALTDDTRNMFDLKAFKKMKSTSILINIARGGIIDQDALYEALHTGIIWAAGLDVTTPEPLPVGHRLRTLPNCTIMPHRGSHTRRTREGMFRLAAENILLALEGKPMRTPVRL